MVAKIKSGKSLIGALNYNEQKVAKGMAKFIAANRYGQDMEKLTFYDKLFRLTDLAERNDRTKTNTVHISLNFSTDEKLADERLIAIANDYMKGIGFGGQPYLVYRHNDAGHPHIHIVSTNIKVDGKRISLHYLGKNESEETRKSIEVNYGLLRAEDQKSQKPGLADHISPVVYGKAETKKSITDILNAVLRTYKYTSVGELNAVLQIYNLQADRGAKDSEMYRRSGLMYWIIDKQGKKIGVPLKASCIYGKPTLKNLERMFRLNEQLRKPYKQELIETLNQVMATPHSLSSFRNALAKKDIELVLRQNEEGRIYGITFIDHKNKTVFNGSDLGKAYSANQLSSAFHGEQTGERKDHRHADYQQQSNVTSNDELLNVLFGQEQEDLAALNKFKRKRKGQRI
ncbi:MAG: relaxase/mobilization nuclease domain-containing protein [Mucilaginibacter sp.]|nr:relaxase/mobilization nuclease domain-containing protein [Mucilaginibacter sp.]